MNTLLLLVTLFACGWLSWYITSGYLLFAESREIVDIPNQRSSHSTPTPRGGGISFVVVFLLISALLGAAHLLSIRETAGLLAGSLIAAVGYWDDCAGLSIHFRMLLQIAVAAFTVYCLGNARALVSASTPQWIVLVVAPVLVISLVWMINLTNFMDGIDGIAGTEAVTVSVICCLISFWRHGFDSTSLVFATLAAAVLGFLRLNWPPAKIFMGDVGSGFLGFCFGALALLAATRHRLSLWTPVILLGVFIVDATFTLLRRMVRGDQWYSPHRTHAFQHLAQRFGHRRTTLATAAVTTLWLGPWALLAEVHSSLAWLCLIASWLPLAAAASVLRAGEPLSLSARRTPALEWARRMATQIQSRCPTAKSAVDPSLFSLGRHIEAHALWCQLLLLAPLNYACIYFAFFTRFDGSIPKDWSHWLPLLALVWTLVESAVLLLFRVHRSHWQFTSAAELPHIAGISLVASSFGAIVMARLAPHPLPRSVYLLNAIYAVAAFAGTRYFSRFVYDGLRSLAHSAEVKRVLIYGADRSGVGILSELRRQCLEYRAVGFIDDRPDAQGSSLSGLPVLGTAADIGRLAMKYGIRQVLVPSHAQTFEASSVIVRSCIAARLEYCVVTPLDQEMRQGRRKTVRDIAIEDLLGRPEVTLDTTLSRSRIAGRVIMITGAAGSIGAELCRQIAKFTPSKIVGYEINETALFFIEREMQERFPHVPFIPCIGSVQNLQRLSDVLAMHQPELVYHAAAYKHVPMMEQHIFEVIENNIFGTAALLRACEGNGVSTFVMISSDKAVRPTSVMGVSKRVAEMIVRASSSAQITCVSTRFGNVLGSNGSVIPVFREQIARGGPVKVTHPEMVRYFMTIPEAAQLVIQASCLGSSNEIFVLDMGAPVRILDLAERLVRLMGMVPHQDIAIEFSGLRPGEKLYEELNMNWEEVSPTAHPRIAVFKDASVSARDPRLDLQALRAACAHRNAPAALSMLQNLVPDYTPSHEIRAAVAWLGRQEQAANVHTLQTVERPA